MSGSRHGSEGGEAEAVRIWLLGGFRVSVGDSTVRGGAWRLRKAASLVKLLALAPGHRLHREQAMEALWPNLGIRAASNNLRQTLHAARRALAPNPAAGSRYLASEDELLVLSPEGQLWVDVDAFEEAAGTARRARDPAAYRAALELYSGDLLPGDRYEEWADGRREELRHTLLSLHVDLARVYEECGEFEKGIEALGRAVTEEPTNEEAHAGLMRLYALSHRPGEALAQYERLREALSGQLAAESGATTQRLREDIAVGRFPPDQPLVGSPPKEQPDVGKHNLPVPRTSFVGRERETVEVKRALAMTRLLTLTGAGGSGKTRLALEVARDLVGAYPDGAWLVELAPLAEGELVLQAVAGALEVREQPGRPLTDALVDTLRSKATLLVLDNCEHLVEATASLVDTLLDSCPRLRVLATSREALGVEGEVVWRVPALSLPDPQGLPTTKELERAESARLFAVRARQRDPCFALTPDNARAVAQICRKLDGIPLAVELAAARVGALAVEEIANRLEDSLGLLTSGGRTAVPRQRTLRGALGWSYELLSEGETRLFGRLSVFAGGWTLEAAEAVGSGEGVEESDVLELLSGLVDKSLVLAEASGDGGLRYRLLEPIRQYALEKLEETGEAEELRSSHAEFFLALAEEAEPELTGPEESRWLDRLEPEYDNMRASLSWSLERGEAELGLRLAGALRRFWDARGYYDEGLRWLEALLAKKGAGASAALRAKALYAKGWLAYGQGDIDGAEAAAAEGLRLSEEAGLKAGLATSLRIMLGRAARDRGDYEKARRLFEEGLTLSREAGDRHGIAWARMLLSSLSFILGDYERGIRLYEENLPLARELGDTQLISWHLIDMGHAALLAGEHERAAALLTEAAALLRERGHKYFLEYALENLGWVALAQGDHQQAKVLHEESLALCKELGNHLVAAESIEGLACVAGARGEAERAARLFGAAQALHKAVGIHKPPDDVALREPYLSDTRSLLEQELWETFFAEGQEMTFEQAAEYALSAFSEEKLAIPASPAPELSLVEDQPEEPPATALTRREREVASLVAQGLTNRQIASKLVLSEHTVHHHLSRILKKLDLRSREQIASRLRDL